MDLLQLLKSHEENFVIDEEGVAKFSKIAGNKEISFSAEIESAGKEALIAGLFSTLEEVVGWIRKLRYYFWEHKPTFYLKAWVKKGEEFKGGAATCNKQLADTITFELAINGKAKNFMAGGLLATHRCKNGMLAIGDFIGWEVEDETYSKSQVAQEESSDA